MAMEIDRVLGSTDAALHRAQRMLDSHDRVARGLEEILRGLQSGHVFTDPAHIKAVRDDLAEVRMECASAWGQLAVIRTEIDKLRRDIAGLEG